MEEIELGLVPTKNECFVPWGNYDDISMIIKERIFFPTYVQGPSGDGKTLFIKEACAEHNRELIRCNITAETDEDDLFGGYRLIDGNTVWQDGPVIIAMKRGAILLLDEIDLGTAKVMCLQPVLEGDPIYVKKIKSKVSPVKGFQIFATANTKGKGSVTGHFVGTNVMNEALLDRFCIMLKQNYPNPQIESTILNMYASKFYEFEGPKPENEMDKDVIKLGNMVKDLVKWGEAIRAAFDAGSIDEVITTRRLIDIMYAYFLFKDYHKAIKVCIERFDEDVISSMLQFFDKVNNTTISEPKEKNANIESTS